MSIKLLYWWDVLRDKLWFIPSVFSLAGVAIALLTLQIDTAFDVGGRGPLQILATTGASGRSVLASLIGALVTVLGLAFSLTMVAVAQTSSQYGPRLIRSLFNSNVTQYVIGMFLFTITYCMIVLQSIRDSSQNAESFTPNLSILLAELAGAACLFGLLRFSHHMTSSMRAETLLLSIYKDLCASADTLFPECANERTGESADLSGDEAWQDLRDEQAIEAESAGYLQAIDLSTLLALAKQHDFRLEVAKRPGDFVHEGDSFVGIEFGNLAGDEQSQILYQCRNCFLVGSVRTPRQDVEAGVLELVEAGVRALSPGVNDPMTAINVIDYLSTFLRRIVQRKWPEMVVSDSDGTPRIYTKVVTFAGILDAGYDQLRQYAADSVAVHCRLLEGLVAIAEVTFQIADRTAIRRQAEMILRSAESRVAEQLDVADILRRGERVFAALEPDS